MRFFVFCGILFPFLMTALGAAIVFLFRRGVDARAQRICLGFAAGVMSAASAFSLLVPAAEQMDRSGEAWIALPVSFLIGAAAICLLDLLIPRGDALKDAHRKTLMMAAVTLHNIPEGMAVGLAFAAVAQGCPGAALTAAGVALGIGLQNLPEGAAIALPLRQGGMSRGRSFLLGALSGAVEPLAAGMMLLLASRLAPVMPALMAFSAGAMMLVVFGELSPESTGRRDGALAAMIGFALMMAMDVGLS